MRRTLSKISQGAVASRTKQNVFNKRLNCSRLRHCLRLIGSEFHSRGPAAEKHRSYVYCLWGYYTTGCTRVNNTRVILRIEMARCRLLLSRYGDCNRSDVTEAVCRNS